MSRLPTAVASIVLVVVVALPATASSQVVIATETSRGEYESGVFREFPPEFRLRFEIDEEAGKATLTETTRLKDESVIDETIEYVILSNDDGSSINDFLFRSEDRRGQKILTLVGRPGTEAVEVILIGEDFFEYCKTANGRIYLAAGTVTR